MKNLKLKRFVHEPRSEENVALVERRIPIIASLIRKVESQLAMEKEKTSAKEQEPTFEKRPRYIYD